MSHCPNCRAQDGPCTVKNPCCDCVVKAIRAAEQAEENDLKPHAICTTCCQAVTVEPTGYLSLHDSGSGRSCTGAAFRIIPRDQPHP